MIVFILYIDLLNLSWIIKCLFLRNMEPLKWLRVAKYKRKRADVIEVYKILNNLDLANKDKLSYLK